MARQRERSTSRLCLPASMWPSSVRDLASVTMKTSGGRRVGLVGMVGMGESGRETMGQEPSVRVKRTS